jgi:hypothetical protein
MSTVNQLGYKNLQEAFHNAKNKIENSDNIREVSDFYEICEKAEQEFTHRHEKLVSEIDLYQLLQGVLDKLNSNKHDDEIEAIKHAISILDGEDQ